MKKYLLLIISFILIFSNWAFAYTLTPKDTQATNIITQKIEELIDKRWEKARNIYISSLISIQEKYKNNERIYTILWQIIDNLNIEDETQSLINSDLELDNSNEYTTWEQKLETLEDLEKYYNIKIYGVDEKFTPSEYAGYYADFKYITDKDKQDYDKFVKVFIEEFKKYTPCWIKATKLKSIMLVKDLTLKNVYKESSVRAAMPDSDWSAVYYDIKYISNEDYVREVIHHEFYHLIEYNTYGSFYYKDTKWNSFNTLWFKYKNGGEYAYWNSDYDPSREHEDFISEYSTYGLEEDKAEIYGHIMINDEKLYEKSKKSSNLNNKVNYMKDFITNQCLDMKNSF